MPLFRGLSEYWCWWDVSLRAPCVERGPGLSGHNNNHVRLCTSGQAGGFSRPLQQRWRPCDGGMAAQSLSHRHTPQPLWLSPHLGRAPPHARVVQVVLMAQVFRLPAGRVIHTPAPRTALCSR